MSVKLLCDPIYTLRDTRGCIAHFSVDECARHVLKTFPDSMVYYIRPPKEPLGIPFIFEESLKEDFPGRVKYFEGDFSPNNRVYEFLWRPQWFIDLAAMTGKAWDWDVLLTMRGPAMEQVKWLNFPKPLSPKKIVIQDHFPIFDFKVGAKGLYSTTKDLQLTVLTSYLLADKVVVGADYEVRGIMKTAKSYLSPAMCKRLQKKLSSGFIIPRGLDTTYPLKKKAKRKGEKVVGIFTQRIGLSGRHPFAALDTFFYSFVRRDPKKVKFHISTNSMIGLNQDLFKKYSFVEFYQATRVEFYKRLKESDFCISYSTTEGMTTSILEAICWGCIPILVRYEWSEDMVGEDYPFLFTSLTEAVAMVDKILDDPEGSLTTYQVWYKSWFLPYLERCGRLFGAVGDAVNEHIETRDRIFTSKDKELFDLIEGYVGKHGIVRSTLYDILTLMYADGLLRVDPAYLGIGYKSQSSAKAALPVRLPKYYQVLHELLKKTGWKRGLEVGSFIVTR